MSALVGGKAAGEADDERVGVDLFKDLDDSRGISLVGEPFGLEVTLHEVDELVFHRGAHFPDLFVFGLEDAFPCFGIALVIEYLLAELFGVESLPFACGPGGHVHTVGDVANMAFFP